MKIVREQTEFGLDIIRGLPKAYYYSKNNIPHKCIVKPKLKELYELVSDNVEETANLRVYNPEDLYLYDGPSWSKTEWLPPPLKKLFKKYLKFDKPTIVINNKCTAEWIYKEAINTAKEFNLDINMDQIIKTTNTNKVSVNHYSLPMLKHLIELLSNKFKILYISPILDHKTYFVDNNVTIPFNDFDFIEKNYPQVYTIKQFLKETNLTDSFNLAQFMFEASSEKHLTVIGGNAKISSYFGGDVIIYRWEGWKKGHRKGNRDIFKSGSWLKRLSGANIIGLDNYNDILKYIKNNWL